jgi:hypothetical protein
VDPGKPFRVGALVVEREIDRNLITGALAKLAADPDAKDNPRIRKHSGASTSIRRSTARTHTRG